MNLEEAKMRAFGLLVSHEIRDEGFETDLKGLIEKIYESQQKPKNLLEVIVNEKLGEYTNINQNAFNEWMAYKKYKNKGAITKTLNMLNKYDFQTQQEMVDKSIMNEYKGLFEPKQQKSRTDNNVSAAMGWLEENETQDLKVIGG